MIDENKEEEYNVKKNCYGCTQKEQGTALIEGYWNQCNLWNPAFNQTMKPTTKEVYYWLMSKDNGKKQICNIGSLLALLIWGNL